MSLSGYASGLNSDEANKRYFDTCVNKDRVKFLIRDRPDNF